MLDSVKLDSKEAKDLFRQFQRTNMIEESEGLWEVRSLSLVRNEELVARYDDKKKRLLNQVSPYYYLKSSNDIVIKQFLWA